MRKEEKLHMTKMKVAQEEFDNTERYLQKKLDHLEATFAEQEKLMKSNSDELKQYRDGKVRVPHVSKEPASGAVCLMSRMIMLLFVKLLI